MSLEGRILEDLKTAMKARDELSTAVLRMLKSQLMLEKTKAGGSHELNDEQVAVVFAGYAKKLVDSIEQFEKGGRQDLVDRHQAELEVVKRYLPEPAGEAEIEQAIREVIAQTGASGPVDMGRVMAPLMARLKGRVDGKKLSQAVRESLSGK